MAFSYDDLTPEQIQKGMTCKSLDEFQTFIKGEGFDLDEAEAQAIFEDMYELELSNEELDAVAGGLPWDMPADDCGKKKCQTYHKYRK